MGKSEKKDKKKRQKKHTWWTVFPDLLERLPFLVVHSREDWAAILRRFAQVPAQGVTTDGRLVVEGACLCCPCASTHASVYVSAHDSASASASASAFAHPSGRCARAGISALTLTETTTVTDTNARGTRMWATRE